MKKKLFALLALVMCLSVCSCGAQTEPPIVTEPANTTDAPATEPITEPITEPATEPVTEAPVITEPVSLDGKKVIIIGNSYVYNGKMVITQSSSAYTQVSRANDKGYFYHLCPVCKCLDVDASNVANQHDFVK